MRATKQVYEIRTVDDFLKVPRERRRVCLREFRQWLAVVEWTVELINAEVGREVVVCKKDAFMWNDDGKHSIGVRVLEG